MKKNENILNQLRIREKKFGIEYAKSDGLLAKWLHIIFTVFAILNVIYSGMIAAGQLILTIDRGTEVKPLLSLLIVATSVLFVSCITGFWYKKGVMLYVTSFLATASSITSGVIFAIILTDAKGMDNISVKGLNGKYYTHAALLSVVLITIIWLFIINIRQKVRTNNSYNLLVERLYKKYNKEISKMSDTEFNEFLSDYDPKYEAIRKKREKQGYENYDNIISKKDNE